MPAAGAEDPDPFDAAGSFICGNSGKLIAVAPDMNQATIIAEVVLPAGERTGIARDDHAD